jgi:secretion/DNA translocation related TadE-like protein
MMRGRTLMRGRTPTVGRTLTIGKPNDKTDEYGSASVLMVGIVGVLVTAVATVLPLYIGMSVRQSVISAADASALAAADVAVGIIPGIPCEIAATVATANSAVLTACVFDGLVVTVSTQRDFLGLALRADATAGPPESSIN